MATICHIFPVDDIDKSLNVIAEKILNGLYTSKPELRYAHLEIEKLNKRIQHTVRDSKIIHGNVLSIGGSGQLNLLAQQLTALEETLSKAAYPDIDKELSVEDIEELKLVFEGSTID